MNNALETVMKSRLASKGHELEVHEGRLQDTLARQLRSVEENALLDHRERGLDKTLADLLVAPCVVPAGSSWLRLASSSRERQPQGYCPVHGFEIEQITGHNLRSQVAQRLRAFVFLSHHRTHRFALLQQHFGDGASYAADATRRAGNQNGSVYIRLSYAKGSSLANTVGRYSATVG